MGCAASDLAEQRSHENGTCALKYDPAARYEVKVEDIEYRSDGDRSWLALTYQPQGPGPFPALMEIHGGAWNNGDRTE